MSDEPTGVCLIQRLCAPALTLVLYLHQLHNAPAAGLARLRMQLPDCMDKTWSQAPHS